MADSGSHTFSIDQRLHSKALAVVRSLFFQKTIFHRMISAFLYHFLKHCLAVIKNPLILQIVQDKFHNKSLCRFKSTVQIHSPDQRFQGIRNDGISFTTAHHFLTSSKEDKLRKPEFSCTVGKTLFTYHAGTFLGQLTFLIIPEFFVQEITADQLQHRISKKLQTLIASKLSKVFFVGIGAVCHCLLQ